MAQLQQGYDHDSPDTLHGLAYVAFQELATRIAHRNTGRYSDDPVADRIMVRIAADANLDMVFYRDIIKAALDIEPSAACARSWTRSSRSDAGRRDPLGHAARDRGHRDRPASTTSASTATRSCCRSSRARGACSCRRVLDAAAGCPATARRATSRSGVARSGFEERPGVVRASVDVEDQLRGHEIARTGASRRPVASSRRRMRSPGIARGRAGRAGPAGPTRDRPCDPDPPWPWAPASPWRGWAVLRRPGRRCRSPSRVPARGAARADRRRRGPLGCGSPAEAPLGRGDERLVAAALAAAVPGGRRRGAAPPVAAPPDGRPPCRPRSHWAGAGSRPVSARSAGVDRSRIGSGADARSGSKPGDDLGSGSSA